MEYVFYIFIGLALLGIAVLLIYALIRVLIFLLPLLLGGAALIGCILIIYCVVSETNSKSPTTTRQENVQAQPANIQEIRQAVNLKEEVNLSGLKTQMNSAIFTITDAYHEILGADYQPTITSGNDFNGHCQNSAHYKGAALDFRLKDIDSNTRDIIVSKIRENLGDKFLVLHESAGTSNEHLHVQINKKNAADYARQ